MTNGLIGAGKVGTTIATAARIVRVLQGGRDW